MARLQVKRASTVLRLLRGLGAAPLVRGRDLGGPGMRLGEWLGVAREGNEVVLTAGDFLPDFARAVDLVGGVVMVAEATDYWGAAEFSRPEGSFARMVWRRLRGHDPSELWVLKYDIERLIASRRTRGHT